jgi:hypothetical protein
MILVLFVKVAVEPEKSVVKVLLCVFVIVSMGNILTAAGSKNV